MRRRLLSSLAAAASASKAASVSINRHVVASVPIALAEHLPVFRQKNFSSDAVDHRAALAVLVHGLFYSNWRRMGNDAFQKHISSISGILGLGALTTRLSVGLPTSARGSTNDDEVLLFFQKILTRVKEQNLDINDANADEVMKIVVDVISNDDSHIYSKLRNVTDQAYEHYCQVTGFKNVDRNLVEEQVRLETMARELSASKYRRLKEELAVCGKLANLKVTQRILLDWYNPLVTAIEQEQRQIEQGVDKHIDRRGYEVEMLLLPAELLAVVTLHEVLNMAVKCPEVVFVKIALSVGRAVKHEFQLHQARLNSSELKKPTTTRLALARNELLRKDAWSTSSYIKLGSRLVQLLTETARMPNQPDQYAFTHSIAMVSAVKKRGLLCMNPDLLAHINMSHLRQESLGTQYMPMVIPPMPWVTNEYGGYLSTRSTVMRVRGSKDQVKCVQLGDLSKIYEALNVLSSVPWRVNSRVFSVLQTYWDNGGGVPSLPTRQDAEFPELVKGDRQSQRRYNAVEKYNRELHSLRCDLELKLEVARMFQDNNMYLPHNIDFRGRAYSIPPHLQHMGNDASRGLLMFAEKKPLGLKGLFWLKVQIANLFGNDKLSLEDRAKWAESISDKINQTVKDPVGYKWWLEADSPWQFLACCYEYVDAMSCPDGPENYKCGLPIHMDGSCNGLQHYAAMGLDEHGGRAVNLSPSDDGLPADVYMRVCDLVNELINSDAASGNPLAKNLQGRVGRKIVKQTVMTSVYGVTFIGAREQIERRLRELDVFENMESADLFQHSAYLATLTLKSLGNMFSSAQKIMDWMVKSARIIANSTSQPVTWITPLGLPIVQPYRRPHNYMVKTAVQTVVLVDTESLLPVSGQRQCSAFPPNYVHSLDSTHMMMTASACHKRQITFAAVHDSYWTHPCSVDEMNRILREQFVELHSQPLLETLAESFRNRFPTCEFPNLPGRGTLNLQDVLKSPYFFN